MNLDKFFTRRRGPNYTCYNLACEVWEHLTGRDISRAVEQIGKRATGELKMFRRLERPVSPCLALFQGMGHFTHVGVFIDGRVLHLGSEGVMCVPVSTLLCFGFKTVKYYAVDDN